MKAMIRCNALIPGNQIPAQLELCASYEVSRTVVRQALGELKREGLVTARKGKDTFVVGRKIHANSAWKLTASYEDIVQRGLIPLTQMLHNRVVSCRGNVAAHLQLAPGSQVIEAITASEREARLLRIEPGSPPIMLDSISYLDEVRPVEYYHAVHPGDQTRFEVELVRPEAPKRVAKQASSRPESE